MNRTLTLDVLGLALLFALFLNLLMFCSQFAAFVINIKGLHLFTAMKEASFPPNSKGATGNQSPKIIFDANFVKLESGPLKFVVDWKLRPADGACTTDEPDFVADVILDPTTLFANNISASGADFARELLSKDYKLFPCFQYSSKDACAGRKNDTFDFTVVWKVSPDVYGTGHISNDPQDPGIHMRVSIDYEILSGDMFFQVKDNATGEYVPFKLNKAQGLPQDSALTVDSIKAVPSDSGVEFKFKMSKKIRTLWKIYYERNSQKFKRISSVCVGLTLLLHFVVRLKFWNW